MKKPAPAGGDSQAFKRLERLMTTGNLWLYIVSICSRKGAHAYALPELVEKRFGFKPSRLMCYIVLYRLKAEGMIDSQSQGRRVYYRASKYGMAQLARARTRIKLAASSL
ncbi:MAG: hypothetical protein WC506_02850 [Candidatus Micrarchaeia archaeon]